MENTQDSALNGVYLCLFIFLATIFDTQHHGNDFWYFQDKHEHVNNLWNTLIALCLGPILFFALLAMNERFEIGLLSSWITFAWILISLHALIYLDIEINITLFATFLTGIASPINDLLLVPILFLNGGTGFSSYLLQGIPYALGVGCWNILLNSERFNVNYEMSLLFMLILRIIATFIICVLYLHCDGFQNFNFHPEARGLNHIATAIGNLSLAPMMIIWSSILTAVFASIIPEVYLAHFADQTTGTLSGTTDESLYLKILNSTLPLVVVIVCIIFLNGRSDESFIKDLLVMASCVIVISTICIFLVSFAKETTVEAFAIKFVLMGNAFEFCTFSVLCDLMVHHEVVYALAMYTTAWRVVISRCILIVAAFLNYDRAFFAPLFIVKIVTIAATLIIYFRSDEDEIESGRLTRLSSRRSRGSISNLSQRGSIPHEGDHTYRMNMMHLAKFSESAEVDCPVDTKRSDSK